VSETVEHRPHNSWAVRSIHEVPTLVQSLQQSF